MPDQPEEEEWVEVQVTKHMSIRERKNEKKSEETLGTDNRGGESKEG